jgi:L-ascorbate metabolism protein UlaG (beta-lactamase superfamily)
MLVDTGTVVESPDFMATLRSIIDPADLRWIWLTHTDADHIGSLHQLLEENPKLRVITTFLGVGIMSLFAPLPMDRVNFVNPGDRITVGDRTLGSGHRRSTTRRPQVSTTTSRVHSSVPTVLEHCWRIRLRTRVTCLRRTCAKARSSGPLSTRRGCTRRTRVYWGRS